jgi:regulator of replication initiation timing
MAKQALARTTDLDPIDRLEEKVTRLIDLIAQLRAAQARAAEDNARLVDEINALRARLGAADQAGAEVAALREERDLIRSRVADMLQQLEALRL